MNGRDPRQELATVLTNPEMMAYEPGEQLPLMPELEPLPRAPKPGTHAHRALLMLAQGRALTHADFIHATDSWRLAAYVQTLTKKLGWPVLVSEVSAPCEAAPARSIASYTLSPRGRAIATEILQ
jgi:hypothetical protein